MPFFTYRQNNSGGSFDYSDDYGIAIIVEASNSIAANAIAESKGVYFDGCSKGMDCSCCGDRWHEPYDEGSEKPEMYGQPIEDYIKENKHPWSKKDKNEFEVVIHYLDGTVRQIYADGTENVLNKPESVDVGELVKTSANRHMLEDMLKAARNQPLEDIPSILRQLADHIEKS